MTKRLLSQRDETAIKRAKEMHDECMKDPDYAAKWNALTSALFGTLSDLPADVLPDEQQG